MVRALISLVLFVFVGGFLVWTTTPGLVRDWSIHQGRTEVSTAQVSGECHPYLIAFQSCDVSIRRADGSDIQDHLIYFNTTQGDVATHAVQSVGDPSKVSSSLAIAQYWNRVATLLGALVLLVLVLLMRLARATQRR